MPLGTMQLGLLVASLAAAVSAVEKLECYTCNSETQPNCHDPFITEGRNGTQCFNEEDHSLINNVNSVLRILPIRVPQLEMSFACLKASYIQKTIDGNEEKVVYRSCSVQQAKLCNILRKNMFTNGYKDVFCEECKTSLCNRSNIQRPAAFVVVPATVLLIFTVFNLFVSFK